MPVSSGIMFLMYSFDRLMALVYIRQPMGSGLCELPRIPILSTSVNKPLRNRIGGAPLRAPPLCRALGPSRRCRMSRSLLRQPVAVAAVYPGVYAVIHEILQCARLPRLDVVCVKARSWVCVCRVFALRDGQL